MTLLALWEYVCVCWLAMKSTHCIVYCIAYFADIYSLQALVEIQYNAS